MEKLERIKEAIMADPQNKNYTDKGIEPLFAAPKTARINIIGQAPGLKTQEAGIYVLGSGWELMKRPFTIRVYLRLFPWTFIFLGMASQGTCHLARALRKSGTLCSLRSVRILS